jgi:hypothetical protein
VFVAISAGMKTLLFLNAEGEHDGSVPQMHGEGLFPARGVQGRRDRRDKYP